VLLVGCTGGGPPPVLEATTSSDPVPALAAAFTAGGLQTRPFDDTSLIISRDHLNVVVFVEDDGESLQAVLPCTRSGLGDGASVARWNAHRRFGRAYLDEDGRPTLASDLLVTPGLTPADVAAWGSLVLDMAWAFVNEVWPEPQGAPANE
jgi:hypothetical protein